MKDCRFWKIGGLAAVCGTLASQLVVAQDVAPTAIIEESVPDSATLLKNSPLTLERALEIAVGNHPSLQEKSAEVERARGMRWDATRRLNPTFGYQANEVGDDKTLGQQGLFYSQEYVTANKLGLNNQVGGWEVESANWDWHAQKRRIEGDVRLNFYAVLAAKRRIEVLLVMDQVLKDGVDLTQRLVDAGEIGKGQVLQAQLQRKQNLLELNNSQRRLTAAVKGLAVVMGEVQLDVDNIEGKLDAVAPELSFEETFQQVAGAHPIIETARAEVLRHQWSVQRERVEPIPNIQTQLGVQFNNASDETTVNLQVGLELPIHNQNCGRIAAASAQFVKASHKVKRLELALRQKYVVAFRDYEVAKQTLSQLEKDLLPLSQESLQSTQALYQAGEISYVGLLQAQKAYVEILLSLNDARQQLWQAVSLIDSGLLSGGLTLNQ